MSKDQASTSTSSADPDLRQQLSVIAEDVRELGRQLKGVSKREVRGARDGIAEAYESGRNRVAEGAERFEGAVQEKPIHSVAIAALAGCIIGWLFSRK